MKTEFKIWGFPASVRLLAVTALLLSVFSCEDALEVKTPINQINAVQVFESVSTADAAMSNLYSELQAYSLLSGGSGGAGPLLGTYTDELTSYDIYSSNADLDLYNNVQQASNYSIKSVWSNAYNEIYLTNSIMEGVAKSTAISEADKKRLKGETLFVRSMVIYYLQQIFGDVPFPVTTDYTVNKALAKTSAEEILVKLTADLTDAVSLLNDQYRNSERIYPNRKAAELLLATVLMTRGQHAAAETLLKGIIAAPLYQWQSDVTKTFKKSGSHILWQLKPLFANEATNEANLYYFEDFLPFSYTLTNELADKFSPTDQRRQHWIKTLTIEGVDYYRPDKYRNIGVNPDEYSIVYRLEEAYLLLAEALAHQNKVAEAIPYVNKVKEKAGVALLGTGASRETVINVVLEENAKEFFTERGIRFLSLKRAGRLNDLQPAKPNWQTHHRIWPLPVSELLLNTNLNPQNNGY